MMLNTFSDILPKIVEEFNKILRTVIIIFTLLEINKNNLFI